MHRLHPLLAVFERRLQLLAREGRVSQAELGDARLVLVKREQPLVVVRLEGTNVEEGQEILRTSGLNFIVADGMKDAAEKVVAATGKK